MQLAFLACPFQAGKDQGSSWYSCTGIFIPAAAIRFEIDWRQSTHSRSKRRQLLFLQAGNAKSNGFLHVELTHNQRWCWTLFYVKMAHTLICFLLSPTNSQSQMAAWISDLHQFIFTQFFWSQAKHERTQTYFDKWLCHFVLTQFFWSQAKYNAVKELNGFLSFYQSEEQKNTSNKIFYCGLTLCIIVAVFLLCPQAASGRFGDWFCATEIWGSRFSFFLFHFSVFFCSSACLPAFE